MDVSLPVLARRRAEAKIEANRERERSRGRSGPVEYVAPKMLAAPPPPKHIPVRQMRAAPAVLDAPVPDTAVIPNVAIEKVSPPLPPRGFVMIVHPPCQPPAKAMPLAGMEPPSRNAAWTGIKHRWCTCEGYAASIASASRNCGDDYYGGRGPWFGNQIGIAPSSTRISGNYQCARSSGNGEPCPYNFESQCGYIYDRGDGRPWVGLAILAIPDHTACYAPHSPWFSTTRYSGKCFSVPGDPDDESPVLGVSDEV